MSIEDNNLLMNLRKWARRNEENFTTEAFVHLLRHLQEDEPEILRDLLKEKMEVDLASSGVDVKDIKFNTQATQPNGVRPDIAIVAPDYLIFVEVKVSAGLGEGQLKKYRDILEIEKGNRTGILVLLSRIEYTSPDREYAHIRILWRQIAKWLDLKSGAAIHDRSKYLIEQFIKFLQGPPPKPPRLLSWREEIVNEFHEMFLSHAEIGKIEELLDYTRLHILLTMMNEVIKSVDDQSQRTLTSGNLDQVRYIGYDIQDRRYCFYICFYGKECKVAFMTWNCKIDIEKAKGRLGHVVANAGPDRWQNELNLNGPEDQIRIKEFYQSSYKFAQTITVLK